VERYDRVVESPFNIRRRHQIDLCQLLNRWEGYKYERHGGISLIELFQALALLRQPAVARGLVLHWVIFNYLIGNSDAHAKNISFLLDRQGISLAPFYDLLPVQAWLPESVMSMSIADENRPSWIESHHWKALALTIGVSPRLIKSYLQRQSTTIENHAAQLAMIDRFNHAERDFLHQQVIPLIKQRNSMLQAALSQW